MEELKKAYEKLGLAENASRDEVEKAFEIILRRHRSRKSSEEDMEYEESLKAYKFIVSHEEEQMIEQKSQERFGKWGKFAGTVQKMDDFFRIHRTKVIGGVIALIVIIVAINGIIDYRAEQKRLASLPPLDLSILFIGNFQTTSTDNSGLEELQQAVLEHFPEWQRVEFDIVYVPEQDDLVYRQKAMAVMAAEKPDMYILDQPIFEWLSPGGGFPSLEELSEGVLKPYLPESAKLYAESEDNPEGVLYGLDLSDSRLAQDLPLTKKKMIATIGWGEERYDNILLFLQRFLEGIEQ